MSSITINGSTFTPGTLFLNTPIIQDEFVASNDNQPPQAVDASSTDYILVQTLADMSDHEKEVLEGMGAAIKDYGSQKTYFCHYRPISIDWRDELLPVKLWYPIVFFLI